MSTLLQLVNEVLRRTGQIEASTLVSAQTPVQQTIDFLNETYVEMLQRLRVERLMRTGTLTTQASVSSYTLADSADVSDVLSDAVIDLTHQNPLVEVDYTYPNRHDSQAVGAPTHFYKQRLGVSPFPQSLAPVLAHAGAGVLLLASIR